MLQLRQITMKTNVNNTISIKDLATGVYMLNITTEDGQVSKKIVKE